MEINFKNIDDIFHFYETHKSDDEYICVINNKKIPTNNHFLELQKNAIKEIIPYNKEQSKCVVSKKNIHKFNPNKIDNAYFWEKAKTKFPLVSVNGGYSKDIYECDFGTFQFAKSTGVIHFMDEYIDRNKKQNDVFVGSPSGGGFDEKCGDINIFEIGYGYGNVFRYYKNNEHVNYVGIDYNKPKDLDIYENLKTINKSGIPSYIKDGSIDIIYSFNVLQHCSQKDRMNYIKNGYKKLKKNGFFIGGMFLETIENSEKPFWGVEDEFGRKYCHFFNQFTEVDRDVEFIEYTKKFGYNIECLGFVQNTNYCCFILKK